MHRPGTLAAIFATLSLLVAALPAAGQDSASAKAPASDEGPAARRAAMQKEWAQKRQAARLERWDANGNGVLDPEELAAEKEELKKSMEAGRERRAAAAAEREKKHQAQLEKYDRDGDGRLSEEERAAMRADRNAERTPSQKAKDSDSH